MIVKKEGSESGMNLKELRNSHLMEMFRFAVNGAVCFVIDWGVMMLLMTFTPIPDWLSIATGFIVSVIVNYLLCVVWVFKGSQKQTIASQIVFVGSSVVGLGLTELFMMLFMQFMSAAIAKVIVTLIVMVWNYIAKRFAIYNIASKGKKNFHSSDDNKPNE